MTNEPETLITPEKLRDLLLLRGVTTDLTNSQLETMIKYKITELSGLIGIDIYPTEYTEIRHDFKDNQIILSNYPIYEIIGIYIDNKDVDYCKYTVDETLGIIYFQEVIYGELFVEYTSCLPQSQIQSVFLPLLVDVIEYGLPENKARQGVSSVKEGDVSVNYNTTDTLGAKIESRINQLKTYNTRIKVL